MKTLALGDLKDLDEAKILEHLANSYSGKVAGFESEGTTEADIIKGKKKLRNKKVLIAYESVGDYGCDSSSFFLLKDKKSKRLFEIHGSHCSCYGFEGQLNLEKTSIDALKARNERGVFSCGGYDESEEENQKLVKDYINKL